MGTDQGIKLLGIPISFIKKKAIVQTDFTGNWQEHKNQLADLLKTENPFKNELEINNIKSII